MKNETEPKLQNTDRDEFKKRQKQLPHRLLPINEMSTGIGRENTRNLANVFQNWLRHRHDGVVHWRTTARVNHVMIVLMRCISVISYLNKLQAGLSSLTELRLRWHKSKGAQLQLWEERFRKIFRQSNKRSGTRLKTESETGEKCQARVWDCLEKENYFFAV